MVSRIKNTFIGFILGLIVWGAYAMLSTPIPYTDVQVVSVSRVPEGVEVQAAFKKRECIFDRLEVFGYTLGAVPKNVPWHPLEGMGKKYDRIAGAQTLYILIEDEDVVYDEFEIRTRHDCGEDGYIDKIFTHVYPGK